MAPSKTKPRYFLSTHKLQLITCVVLLSYSLALIVSGSVAGEIMGVAILSVVISIALTREFYVDSPLSGTHAPRQDIMFLALLLFACGCVMYYASV